MPAGEALLSEYGDEIAKIESLPLKQKKRETAMGKRVQELREGLKEGIMGEARKRACVTGKWMLFPGVGDVDAMWKEVATATVEGRLGIAAKVAVKPSPETDVKSEGHGKRRLICVYTYDTGDMEDVKRVLGVLKELGLLPMEWPKAIYYKCDAFTQLGIANGNQWGLRASLYGSRDRDMRA